MSEDKLKKPATAKKDPPHVVGGGSHGVYNVPNPIVVDESEGHHSGRKVPAATPHKELDK